MFQSPDRLPERVIASASLLEENRSPLVITNQTDFAIRFLRNARGAKTDLVENYVVGHTFPYLEAAAESGRILFDDDALKSRNYDPDGEMAARHVYVVMAVMSDVTRIRGLLPPPSTQEVFEKRIKEIEGELGLIVSDREEAQTPPSVSSRRWRAVHFFATASKINMHIPETERESADREREVLAHIPPAERIEL